MPSLKLRSSKTSWLLCEIPQQLLCTEDKNLWILSCVCPVPPPRPHTHPNSSLFLNRKELKSHLVEGFISNLAGGF